MATHEMEAPSYKTHFVVLAGPLGSGKTTLLEQLLTGDESAADTAVIVNEAGAVSIDGSILLESDKGLVIETLSNGCVCCSLSNDLTFTIEELFATRAKMDLPPFQRIVLECSGLSLPGQVMRSLTGLAHLRMAVSIVCTYDCSRSPSAEEHFDTFTSQLVVANSIVFTMLDIASEHQITSAKEFVGSINPLASIIFETEPAERYRKAFLQLPPTLAFNVPLVRYVTDQQVAHPRIQVQIATIEDGTEAEDVMDWLDNIAGILGERLLRSKALVNTNQGTAILQSVGTTFAAPRLLRKQTEHANVAILITRDSHQTEFENIPRPFGLKWGAGVYAP